MYYIGIKTLVVLAGWGTIPMRDTLKNAGIQRIFVRHGSCPREAVDAVVRVLREGGVVLLGTETVYGLLVDAQHAEAMERMCAIKGRAREQAVQTIVADMAMAEEYVVLDAAVRALAARFLPGPLTLVVPKKRGSGERVLSGNEHIGMRIPAHDFCLAVAHAFGGPINATSANRSGMVPERSVDAILVQLGGHAAGIALVIDEGELPARPATTVVECLPGKPLRIIREGAISIEEVLKVFATPHPNPLPMRGEGAAQKPARILPSVKKLL